MSREQHGFRIAWQTIGVSMIATVVVLTLIPSPPKVDLRLFGWDKAQHFIAYAVLMWWSVQAWPTRSTRWLGVALGMLGVFLEFLQGLTGVRFMEISDMLANCLGVVAGYGLTRTRLGNALHWMDGCIARYVG